MSRLRLWSHLLASSRTIGVLTIVAVATGCATSPRETESWAGWIGIPVRFVEPGGDEAPLLDRPSAWVNVLGVIPGAIFGKTRYLFETPVMYRTDQLTTRFDFSALETALAQQATTITPTATAEGLKIEPLETRFARVATTIGVTDKRAMEIGFRDNVASRDALILVFFDRPCRITGSLPESRTTVDTVDVTVAKPGLVWLRLRDAHITTVPAPSHLVFTIQLPGT